MFICCSTFAAVATVIPVQWLWFLNCPVGILCTGYTWHQVLYYMWLQYYIVMQKFKPFFFLILNVSIILFLILIYLHQCKSKSKRFPHHTNITSLISGWGKKGLPLISLPLIRVTLSNWRFLSGFMCPILLREHQEKNVSDYIIQRKHMWSFTLPDWLLFPIRKNQLWWKLLMTTLSNLQFRNWFGLNCLKMKIYNRPPCNPLLPTMPSFSWVYFPHVFLYHGWIYLWDRAITMNLLGGKKPQANAENKSSPSLPPTQITPSLRPERWFLTDRVI